MSRLSFGTPVLFSSLRNTSSMYSNKQIWYIAYPILISLLMEQLIGMTDTAFLGRVGEIELGASAIAGIFYLAIFMIAFGFSIGTQIMIARRNGEGDYHSIGSLFYQGMYFQIGLATAIFLLSYAFSPLILKKIISSPAIYEAAIDYLHWRVFGAFFSFIAVIFRAFFVGTTQTKTLTLNSTVMVLSNVVFNYILIFGKFGFPELGIAGAAIGSSLAELVSLIFFIVYTRRKIDFRKYGLDVIPHFDPKALRHMLRISFWTMLQNFISLSTWFLFFLYVEHLGERALAITNIVRGVSGILFMITVAFASTCGSLVSNLIGAGHTDKVPALINRHIRLTYCFVLPVAMLFCLMPETILGVYTDISVLRESAITSLWVMCSSYLLTVPGNVYFQAVSGTGNTRTAFILEAIVLIVYVTYITFVVLLFRMDVAIGWTSEHIYNICILLLCHAYIRSGKWSQKRI